MSLEMTLAEAARVLAFEGDRPALLRIIEDDTPRIERVGIECASDPVAHRPMLRMVRVSKGLEQPGVPVRASAILGRTASGSCKASWVLRGASDGLWPFVRDHMFPVVAKVVRVQHRQTMPFAGVDVRRHRDGPA